MPRRGGRFSTPRPTLRPAASAGGPGAMRYAPRVTRDRSLLGESAELKRALEGYADLGSLRAAPDWPALERRLDAALATVRRYEPAAPPAPADTPTASAPSTGTSSTAMVRRDRAARSPATSSSRARICILLTRSISAWRAPHNRDVTARPRVCARPPRACGRRCSSRPEHGPPRRRAHRGRTRQRGVAVRHRDPVALADRRGSHRRAAESRAHTSSTSSGCTGASSRWSPRSERPGAPFVAVGVHLEVHRTRRHRALQMRTLLETLRGETRP